MKLTPLKALQAEARRGAPFPPEFLDALRRDPRAGGQTLYQRCLKQQARYNREAARREAMFAFETAAQGRGFARIAGVDEAGRGPWAGPIVAAAVVLSKRVAGLDDSKKLTPEEREALFARLTDGPHEIGIGMVEPDELDRIGLQAANYQAMTLALGALASPADYALIDGFQLPSLACPQERIVKGDARSLSIAAASIVAKVTRDRIMVALEKTYPGYGFAKHKGYGTAEHQAALEALGPCPAHRRCFGPIAEILNAQHR